MIIALENISQLHEVARIRRGWISDVVWSPNGRVLAVASAEGITFHSAEDLKVMGKLDGHDGPIKGIAVNADGTLLASAGADTTVRLWNLRAGGEQRILRGHIDAVDAVAINADGTRLASVGADKTVRIWDIESGQTLQILEGHEDEITSVVYCHDDLLATAGWDSTIRLWDASGTCKTVLHHDSWVRYLAVNTNGNWLASASRDASVRVWNIETGEEVLRLDAHFAGADAVVFSPDGTLLVTSGRDLAIKFWNTISGQLVHTIIDHEKPVLALAFNKEGTLLATGSGDNTVRLWQIG
ncbi:MAG: WD40 repeat domain-containing protein [Chloroflexota bacterium]